MLGPGAGEYVNSTSTSKNGRSTNKNPPELLLPSRFFIAVNARFVAFRMAPYMRLA